MQRLSRSLTALRRRKKQDSPLAGTSTGCGGRDGTLRNACAVAERALSVAVSGEPVPLDADSLRSLLAAAAATGASPRAQAGGSSAGRPPEGNSGSGSGRRRHGTLYLLSPEGCVFVMSRCGGKVWQNSRMPNGAPLRIKLFYGPHLDAAEKVPKEYRQRGWVVYEISDEKDPLVIEPIDSVAQDGDSPPLGDGWVQHKNKTERVEGWRLVRKPPPPTPLERVQTVEKPFSTVRVSGTETCAIVAVILHGSIPDDGLEELLRYFKVQLTAAAQNPNMRLVFKLDMQDVVVTMAQAKRFLKWVDEVSWQLVLTVRGSVVRLNPVGWVGNMVLAVVNFVLKMKPPPWPNKVLPTVEESDAFLAECELQAAEEEGLAADASRQSSSSRRREIGKQSRLSSGLDGEEEQRPVQGLEHDDKPSRPRGCQMCFCSM